MKKEIFEKIITEKRAKSSNERPKYGIRKLTVGVVSCLLGYMMFMTPNVTLADKVEATPAAVEAKVESIKANTTEEVEQPAEGNTAKPGEKSSEQFDAQSSKATSTNAQDRTARAPEINTEVAPLANKEVTPVSINEADSIKSELETYKEKAIKDIEEAFKFVDTEKAKKSLEDYKKEIADAKSKEEVDAIVLSSKAEPKLDLDLDPNLKESIQTALRSAVDVADSNAEVDDSKAQTNFEEKTNEKGEKYYVDKKTGKEFFKKPK